MALKIIKLNENYISGTENGLEFCRNGVVRNSKIVKSKRKKGSIKKILKSNQNNEVNN